MSEQIVIQTQGLSHSYGKLLALDNVDLSVYRGEVFGFLGPNGAGKTTFIRTLLDFIRPTAGKATIFGFDSVQDSLAIRERSGYLPSELVLWENWTGERYIRWLETVHKKPMLAEAQRLAGLLQYDLTRPLKGLSSGMKRKIGIIATLAHKPELLIMDEPSTGLDPLMQQVFHELVQEVKAEGRTIFLSSHMLQEVEQICDRVGIIRKGRLRAVEKVSDLTQVAFRWMTLSFAESISPNGFGRLDGISDLQQQDNQLRMKVSGEASIDALVKEAAKHTVEDIRFEQPTLEEIFLSYYGNNNDEEEA